MENNPLQGYQISRRTLLGGIAAGTVTVLAGCSFGGGGKSSKTSTKLALALSLPVDSLDPHYVNNGSYISPVGLFEGLVAVDATSKGVVPAIADKWDVSADGLTYTFHIRSDAKFSNGDPISAKDFEWTYQRLLTPTGAGGGGTVGASAYKPSLGIKGASDFQAGTSSDWSTVGVKATDDKTLVMTLDSPNAAFLLGMSNVSMLLLHPPTVRKYPKDWMKPEHWVGSGPYTLTSWTPTSSISMKTHKNYWDRSNVHIDEIVGRVITDPNASQLAYRNSEVDIATASYALIGKDKTLLSQVQEAKGYAVTFYQTMFSKHPASQDVRVRQALAMAVDRDTLTKVVPGSQPGVALVPDAVPGWDKSLAIPYDPEQAKSLLTAAGYPGGKGMPTIQFLDHQRRPESDALIDMWQRTLGLTVKYNVVDIGQLTTIRYQPIKDPNQWGFTTTAFGGLPTWNNWVIDLWGPDMIPFFSMPAEHVSKYLSVQSGKGTGAAKAQQLASITNQYATPEAKAFAAAATAAAKLTDANARTAAFLAAAKQRQALYYEIPVLWAGHDFLVKPTVHGTHINYWPSGICAKGVTKTK